MKKESLIKQKGSVHRVNNKTSFNTEPEPFEPEREKSYLLTCAPNEDKIGYISTQSDYSLRSSHDTLHPGYPKSVQ